MQLWQRVLRGAILGLMIVGVLLAGVAWAAPEPSELSWRDDGIILNWYYDLPGDYDQNGEVNIADLSALGKHLGKVADGASFPVGSIEAWVDGDSNGEINIQDLMPIAANLGRVVEGYDVFTSFDATDYPATPGAGDGPGSFLVAQQSTSDVWSRFINPTDWYHWHGVPHLGAWVFELPEEAAGQQAYFWVRPRFTDGTNGLASAITTRPENHLPLANQHMTYAEWDAERGVLRWYYFYLGDCDVNGEVNTSDLGAIGQFIDEEAMSVLTYGGLLDGNLDGRISFSDTQVLEETFTDVVYGFEVYGSGSSEQYPDSHSTSYINWIDFIDYIERPDGSGYSRSLGDSRPYYEIEIPEALLNVEGYRYFWVTPVSSDESKIQSSNLVDTSS